MGVAMTLMNVGVWDRMLRIVVGAVVGYAAWIAWPGTANVMSQAGAMSLVFLIIGVIALVTGIVGWCPVYALFDVSTHKRITS
jgi:hypothetical protein